MPLTTSQLRTAAIAVSRFAQPTRAGLSREPMMVVMPGDGGVALPGIEVLGVTDEAGVMPLVGGGLRRGRCWFVHAVTPEGLARCPEKRASMRSWAIQRDAVDTLMPISAAMTASVTPSLM